MTYETWTSELTLRDYFAAAALQGGLEQGVENDHAELLPGVDNWWHQPSHIARRAYAIADAMVKAREQKAKP